jgi:hypothetical protein
MRRVLTFERVFGLVGVEATRKQNLIRKSLPQNATPRVQSKDYNTIEEVVT